MKCKELEIIKYNFWTSQNKQNQIYFFPDRMLINPLLCDDVHAEGDTGLKTDKVNSSKKYVTKTPQHVDTTLILFRRHRSESLVELRSQATWISGAAIFVFTETFNLLALKELLP